MNFIKSFKNFNKFDWILYLGSCTIIILSFILAKGQGLSSALTSLIGATALIFIAKGDVLGQILTVVFSVLYGIISISFSYWGEVITYMGMTAPMAVMAAISWIKNPYDKERSQVKVYSMKISDILLMFVYAAIVTLAFYYILRLLNTQNLIFSTVSVTTSFLASYMTYRRSPYYALGYAANDVVLIVLWTLASIENSSYIPMLMCFYIFLANDIYGFVCWRKMQKRQQIGDVKKL